MATLTIKDETYQQLASKAAAANLTLEALIEPALQRLVNESANDPAQRDQRRVAMARWQQAVAERVGRYPTGHALDDSRETIYSGDDDRGR